LSEIVSMFCLCEKQREDKPIKGQIEVSTDNRNKADQIIQLLVPNLSTDSQIYKHFHSFIINYYDVQTEDSLVGLQNCKHYLDWFVKDTEHMIAPFHDFKVPPTLAQRCVWLIWKFLLSNLKTQPELTSSLDTLIEMFLINYRKKNYDVCTNLLWYILLLARQPEKIQLDNRVDFSHHQLIRQSAEINFIYHNLIQVKPAGKQAKKPKNKKLTHQEQLKLKFYENPKNQDFLQTINDVNLLVTAQHSDEPNCKVVTKKSNHAVLLVPRSEYNINTTKSDHNSNKGDHNSNKGERSVRPKKSNRVDLDHCDELIIPVMVSGRKKLGKSNISLAE
jgi:hypothetical protein